MAKVRPGLPQDEVRKILGQPDDVRQRDELDTAVFGAREVWCYGTDAHLTFPTLGCVYINPWGQVEESFGGREMPAGLQAFEEKELRSLLRLIGQVPENINAYEYNPRVVIRIVNTLQPLGKDKALVAISEYLRVGAWADGREGLFLVMRVLFDVPDNPGYMPTIGTGAPFPSEPKNPKTIPRFPIALQDDIPFLIASAGGLGGQPEPVSSHLEYFRKCGKLRGTPLTPTNRPFAAYERLRPKLQAEHGIAVLAWDFDRDLPDQVCRLIHSVYRKKGLRHTDDGVDLSGYTNNSFRWKETAANLDKLQIRWNGQMVQYTFADGSTLPHPAVYPRQHWKHIGAFADAVLTIERQNEAYVNFSLLQDSPRAFMDDANLRIYSLKNRAKPVAEFKIGMGGSGRHGAEKRAVPLGDKIEAILSAGDKVLARRHFVP